MAAMRFIDRVSGNNVNSPRVTAWTTITLVTLITLWLLGGSIRGAELRQRASFPKPAATTVDPDRDNPSEIVVKFHEGTHVRLRNGTLVFDTRVVTDRDRQQLNRNELTEERARDDIGRANRLLASRPNLVVVPLFARDEAILDRERAGLETIAGEELADLNLYYMLLLESANAVESASLINALNALASVEIAYAEPRPEGAAGDIAPPTTFDLTSSEGHLQNATRGGIDADWSWRLPGGRGSGLRVADVESGWIVDHEDLPGSYIAQNGRSWAEFDHGAAVLGILAAADNGFGATGITPDVAIALSSPVWANFYSPHDTAAAIDNAGASLRKGDVLVIEQHYWGGNPPGQFCNTACGNCGQFAYVPMENIQANYDAIRRATAKGIIVVEAAGNGQTNLDNPFYGGRFNRSVRDSGAILVGANRGGGNLNAACWTNFGSRVDLQAWGGSVATLGYGPLNPDPGDDWRQRYTQTFSGTSSATPIVAGAALAVNGSRLADGDPVFDGIAMRQHLVATGTPQSSTSAAIKPIGPQPNLRTALPAVAGRLDGIDPDGMVSGWAFQSSVPGASIQVQFFFESAGGPPNTFGGAQSTSVQRPDVAAFFSLPGGTCNCGISFPIPNAFRDDAPHVVTAVGVDPTPQARHRQLQQPLTFSLPSVRGHLDSIDLTGHVRGWVFAAQSPAQSIQVDVFVDGDRTTGTHAGRFTANASRPDVNGVFAVTGNHGFDFPLPVGFGGGQLHDIVIYGVDPRGVNSPVIAVSQFWFPAQIKW